MKYLQDDNLILFYFYISEGASNQRGVDTPTYSTPQDNPPPYWQAINTGQAMNPPPLVIVAPDPVVNGQLVPPQSQSPPQY